MYTEDIDVLFCVIEHQANIYAAFMVVGVPSLSYLLKFARSRIALQFFQESPFAYSVGYLDMIAAEGKDMEGSLLIPM